MRSIDKYAVLSGLYIAQTLPGHFFANVFSVILRDHGFSLATIGYLQAVSLPWMLKFLWAPLVDRVVGPGGRHVQGIVLLEALFCLLTLGQAALDFTTQLPLVVGLMALSALLAATQDIVTDAMAVRLLTPGERGPGNAVQTGGNLLGVVLGSGVGLVVYQYWGWSAVMIGMAAALLLPLLLLVRLGGAGGLAGAPAPAAGAGGFRGMLRFFRQDGAVRWTWLMLAANAGSMPCMMMINPLLTDLGFAPSLIGLLTGVYGVGVGLAGAAAGGWLIARRGRRPALILGCLVNALAALGLLPLTLGKVDSAYLVFGLGLPGVGFSLVMTAIGTVAMDFTRPGHEGSDYSLQIAVSMLGGGLLVGLSGLVAQAVGYVSLYLLCAGLALGAAGLVWRFFQPRALDDPVAVKA